MNKNTQSILSSSIFMNSDGLKEEKKDNNNSKHPLFYLGGAVFMVGFVLFLYEGGKLFKEWVY